MGVGAQCLAAVWSLLRYLPLLHGILWVRRVHRARLLKHATLIHDEKCTLLCPFFSQYYCPFDAHCAIHFIPASIYEGYKGDVAEPHFGRAAFLVHGRGGRARRQRNSCNQMTTAAQAQLPFLFQSLGSSTVASPSSACGRPAEARWAPTPSPGLRPPGLRGHGGGGWGGDRTVLKGEKGRGGGGLVTPTQTNLQEDALCFVVKTWARHNTTETGLNNGWRLAAVGGGGWWRLAAGGWRLVIPWGLSLRAVLNKKQRSLEDSPGYEGLGPQYSAFGHFCRLFGPHRSCLKAFLFPGDTMTSPPPPGHCPALAHLRCSGPGAMGPAVLNTASESHASMWRAVQPWIPQDRGRGRHDAVRGGQGGGRGIGRLPGLAALFDALEVAEALAVQGPLRVPGHVGHATDMACALPRD